MTSTTFKEKGIDPDISREEFIGNEKLNEICSILKVTPEKSKHNSLYDAMVIQACHYKLDNYQNYQYKTANGGL